MKQKIISGTDLMVAPICFGAAGFGAQVDGAELDALLKIYRDAGGNFIDTAHSYAFWLPAGSGSSERWLGDYLRRNGKGDLIIATKGGYPGQAGYRKTDQWLTPARIGADLDDSLGRLGLDCIDLYWLHRDETSRPVGEIMETLNQEVRRGRIRWLGASNWRGRRIAEANAYAHEHGLSGFVASQTEYNLAQKNIKNPSPEEDDGTKPRFLGDSDWNRHCATGLPLVAYSATAAGYFASDGKLAQEVYDNHVSRERLRRATQLATELGCTVGQVALAWLLSQPFPVFPLIGSLNRKHLRENLGATDFTLNEDQVIWLKGERSGDASLLP